jgi:hypothetical protein
VAFLVVADRNTDRIVARQDEARDADSSHGPVRQCLATGARRDKSELLRFVVDPNGALVPDLKERLPGRGLWLSAERDIVKTAISKRLFAKAARAAVTVPADLLEQLERLLVRGCQERLGLARRAGQAVSGYEKALAQVQKGKAALVIVAGDAGANVRQSGLGTVLRCALTADELGGVFDRARAVYIALARGPLTERIRVELMRLAAIRGVTIDAAGGARKERLRAHG